MLNYKQRLMLLVLAASLLTSCGTTNSSVDTAPPLRQYSSAFQRKLADEIENATPDAAFPVAIQDYSVLRTQVRSMKK